MSLVRWLPRVAVIATFSLSVAASPHDARAFLSTTFHLSRADFVRLDSGQVVSRTLDTNHGREVATLGIVRIATTPEKYVERLTDIATFKKTEDVLQIGTFSNPPQIADVAALTLDDADARRLQMCRVDDCDVQMSAEAIQLFARTVDWRTADATQRATNVMRQLLVDYVTRYRDVGAAALMEYADSSPRLNLGREFASLVDNDRVALPQLSDVRQHLLRYPSERSGAVDVIYWSKERVYKRPVISATHLSIMGRADDSPVRFAIASKQIYAMHYFDASLGLTLLVPDRSASSPATYVVYLNRSRIDLFDGVFVLEVDLDTLHRRLDARPDNEWGRGKAPKRELVVRSHRTKEDVPRNGIAIDATAPLAQVVDEILRLSEADARS